MNFKAELSERTKAVQKIIYQFSPAEEGFARTVCEAINYSMKAGGKRMRPLLMQEAYRLFDGSESVIEPFMAAMEMIHTHSLIHDDLPALDNDEFRRGKPTTHAVYGEALGILSGDTLLNYAYETALSAFSDKSSYPQIASALQILANKSGIFGMLGGQSVDVTNDKNELSLDMLNYIYQNKTAALIEASMMIGAVLAGASAEETKVMEQAGRCVGMAFQIQDDILDVTSTTKELGKPVKSDARNHKTTYVTCKGIEQAGEDVKQFSNQALALLDSLPNKNPFLYSLIEFLITREK